MRFIVMSDTHFFAVGRGNDSIWWNRTLISRSKEIGESIVRSMSKLKPDFVVHCGDFTGHCDMENFDAGRKIMDLISCPWYAVAGNHDTWYPGVREAISGLYGLPDGRCYYSRTFGRMHFIFLDTCCWLGRDGSISRFLDREMYDSGLIEGFAVPPQEVRWLETELQSHIGCAVILVSHIPLGFKDRYPVRTMPDGSRGKPDGIPPYGFTQGLSNINELQSIFEKYRNVRLAFSGHTHINDVHINEGIVYCQTCSLREYPFEFRLVEATDSAISVSTYGLDNELFKKESFLIERDNSWVEGCREDRAFTVAV